MKFKVLFKILMVIGCIIMMLLMAIYNGAPLTYSDSATYILSGINGFIPIDRPIIYGKFLMYSSFSISLWLSLICQCLIGIYLLWLLMKEFVSKEFSIEILFLLVVILTCFSSLSYYASQIMPDFFTACCFMSFGLIFCTQLNKTNKYIVILLFIFLSVTHLSNLISCFIISILMIFFSFFKSVYQKEKKYINISLFKPILLCFSAYFFVCLVHSNHNGNFTASRASHVFLVGRFVETGVLKSYLDNNCFDSGNILCERKNSLPKFAFQFLWADSILVCGSCKQNGWEYCWLDKKKEYNEIIYDVFTKNEYASMYLFATIKDFIKQLYDIDNAYLSPVKEPVSEIIEKNFSLKELKAYKSSKQWNEKFRHDKYNFIIVPFMNICTLLILVIICISILFSKKKFFVQNFNFLNFTHLIGMFYLVNAWVCVFFSTELNRYQGRIAWVMTVLIFAWAIKIIQFKQTKNQREI